MRPTKKASCMTELQNERANRLTMFRESFDQQKKWPSPSSLDHKLAHWQHNGAFVHLNPIPHDYSHVTNEKITCHMLPSHLDDYDDDVRARPSFWCLPPGAFWEAQLADGGDVAVSGKKWLFIRNSGRFQKRGSFSPREDVMKQIIGGGLNDGIFRCAAMRMMTIFWIPLRIRRNIEKVQVGVGGLAHYVLPKRLALLTSAAKEVIMELIVM